MTEREWLTDTNPQGMLQILWGKTSERKMRLFAVACCRRIWHLLPDERSRQAVEVAGHYADAQVTEEELEKAANAASDVWHEEMERASTEGKWDRRSLSPPYTAASAAYNAAIPLGWWGAAPAFVEPYKIVREVTSSAKTEGAAQCDLIRDIFGNPFRPITLDPAWPTPNVVKLAQTIYDEQAFDRLPGLSDTLEEAGCTHANILGHCRGPGLHVRGCWVVDLLLRKG